MAEIIYYCQPKCSVNGRIDQREINRDNRLALPMPSDSRCPICGEDVVWDVIHEEEVESFVKEKNEINKKRPYRHGGKKC